MNLKHKNNDSPGVISISSGIHDPIELLRNALEAEHPSEPVPAVLLRMLNRRHIAHRADCSRPGRLIYEALLCREPSVQEYLDLVAHPVHRRTLVAIVENLLLVMVEKGQLRFLPFVKSDEDLDAKIASVEKLYPAPDGYETTMSNWIAFIEIERRLGIVNASLPESMAAGLYRPTIQPVLVDPAGGLSFESVDQFLNDIAVVAKVSGESVTVVGWADQRDFRLNCERVRGYGGERLYLAPKFLHDFAELEAIFNGAGGTVQ